MITGSVFTVVIICLILGIWMCKFNVYMRFRLVFYSLYVTIIDRSYRKRKERKENVNILHNGILNYNMALRNRNGNADINPSYDFNGRTLTTNDLPRISRDELRIQKWVIYYFKHNNSEFMIFFFLIECKIHYFYISEKYKMLNNYFYG